MHGYLSNGYLNSLLNFNYKKAEKISSLRPLLDQPWITTKTALNIMKVSVHTYHPNAHQKIWSNITSERFEKGETLLCSFSKVVVKREENSSECRESWSACFSIKSTSKSMIKFQLQEFGQSETPSCSFAKVLS